MPRLPRTNWPFFRKPVWKAVPFEIITPDAKNNWFNQSNSDFESLIPLADRMTKFGKSAEEETAVFQLYTNGVKSNRDEWVYDFDTNNLRAKALFFADAYNRALEAGDGVV